MRNLRETSNWHRVQRGDTNAFNELYRRHVSHMLNYGLRLCGSLATAEDAVQELFVDLWQNREYLPVPRSERPYLLGMLRNKLIQQYRRDRPYLPEASEIMENSPDTEPSIEQRWIDLEISRQQRDRIQAAIKNLTPRQREVLHLRYFDELTYEEICELTGLSYQSARSQVYHALKIMREILGQPIIATFLLAMAAIQ